MKIYLWLLVRRKKSTPPELTPPTIPPKNQMVRPLVQEITSKYLLIIIGQVFCLSMLVQGHGVERSAHAFRL